MAQFLDKQGVTLLWSKVKNLVTTTVNTAVGAGAGKPNGAASLDSNGKLPANQLPDLKTINNQSIVGSGNIEIDLGIYEIVESLPGSNQNPNKIYLVLSTASGEQNKYTEYFWTGSAWEKLGEYDAKVELADYVKKNELAQQVANANFVKFTDIASTTKAGVIKLNYTNTGKNYKVQADSEGNAFVTVDWQNTTYNPASGSSNGLMTSAQFNKLEAIAANATADSAIPTTELEGIFV